MRPEYEFEHSKARPNRFTPQQDTVSVADERVVDVSFTKDALRVALMDGRSITVPLTWYPRLLNATSKQRKNWRIGGGGYGIHWPDVDEDLSSERLLRGAPAPGASLRREASLDGKHDVLLKAIRERKLISFDYKGKLRVAEPHDYGIQNGLERLLCYQVGGDSNTGRLPSWRLVEVAKLDDLKIINRKFPGNRPAPSGQHHNWDVVFARVGETHASNHKANSL
jgi:hypothetical protein